MNTARLLVVEDDRQVADVVVYVLERHGFAVETAADGKAGLACFLRGIPDLVVLDLNLPLLSGRELFQAMRRHRPTIPVIMLTCQSDEIDRIVGLEMGADDYISKPFNAKELVARVRAVLRRCNATPAQDTVIAEGPIVLNSTALCFTYFGERVELSRQELELMKALAGAPTRTFTREALISRMYEDSHPVTDRTVDACIKRIRKKLEAVHPGIDPIRTLYGMGYRLNETLSGLP